MIALYIIIGLITLLALLGVVAPHGQMGGYPRPVIEDVAEDDVFFIEEDEDDTLPFIRLPFSQATYQAPLDAPPPFSGGLQLWP